MRAERDLYDIQNTIKSIQTIEEKDQKKLKVFEATHTKYRDIMDKLVGISLPQIVILLKCQPKEVADGN